MLKVPYGCLVPEKVANLLVAGRCVAGDKTSHAAMRSDLLFLVLAHAQSRVTLTHTETEWIFFF